MPNRRSTRGCDGEPSSEEKSPCYDLLLKGGQVIDPANNINAPLDVAIRGDAIACVAQDIPAEGAERVLDVKGLYVTPGLIDLHVHVTPPLDHPICADVVPLRTGVTTLVDAGSTGWKDFEEFKAQVIDLSKTRVLALLNIAGCGMVRREQDPAEWDVLAAVEMIERYRETIVGLKAAHYMGADFGPIDRAVHAGRLTATPVMVDFWVKAT
ncbi:MAG: amidohydrolase/deacetylase family metallohydrolase, partial [Deltaproteobacteria bacterium]|nr:amidohydrolase/deacetylase family metallohydrolase [Deltaproteobacteria bacterium]